MISSLPGLAMPGASAPSFEDWPAIAGDPAGVLVAQSRPLTLTADPRPLVLVAAGRPLTLEA